MVALYKDPTGQNVFSKTVITESANKYMQPTKGDMETLRLKVLELEKKLSQVL